MELIFYQNEVQLHAWLSVDANDFHGITSILPIVTRVRLSGVDFQQFLNFSLTPILFHLRSMVSF